MKTRYKILIIVLPITVMGFVMAGLFYFGVILFNNPSKDKYPVRGVDVSSYQGDIDWSVLSTQEIHFAFIKATEGSGYKDAYFDNNFQNAMKTNLRIGAYHFFSFDSSGETQAENFISAVPVYDQCLPPVIDFEFYGDKEDNPPHKDKILLELDVMLDQLSSHYGKKPIIYATEKAYKMYLSGRYDEYDIWIRNVLTTPTLSDAREWTFWQYTNREKLEGYHGKEKYIDMNVFNGTLEEFYNYAK